MKSIINSSAEKGARIQRIPSLTPPNSFSATGAPSQGVERGLGRESQVAATINQISSKLSRLFDRHHSPAPLSRLLVHSRVPLLLRSVGDDWPEGKLKKRKRKKGEEEEKKGERREKMEEMSFRGGPTFSMIESSSEQERGEVGAMNWVCYDRGYSC